MQRKFIANLALVLFLNLLIKPFWILGIDRVVQNKVGAEEYGIYFALFNFSFLLNILLDLGITNYNNKNIAQNNHLLNKHISSLIVLKFMLCLFYLIITMSIGKIIGYNTYQLGMLFLMAFNQFLISFILYLRSNLAGLHLFKADSFISVLDRIIMIGLCGILLWGGLFDGIFEIEWFVLIQTLAYLLTAAITFTIVKRKANFKRLNWNYPFFVMILKQSFPFAVLVLLMTFYNRIDTVMIERLLDNGAMQSGIYASAYRLLDATNMIAYLFAALLLPIFSRMIKLKENVEQLVALSFRLLLVPALIIAVGCFFYSTELMKVLYTEHIENSAEIFRILMFCFVAVSSTYIFGTLLTANGNLKQLNIIAASGMAINILLNFILIPQFMAKGSALVSLTTQMLVAFAQILMVQHHFKFRINYSLIFTMIFFAAGLCLIADYSKTFSSHWVMNFITMIALSFAFAFACRLISVRAIYKILKYG